MIPLLRFIINENIYFEILVPKLIHKDNSYCQPTQKLHIFDIVTLIYSYNNIKTELLEDTADEIIAGTRCAFKQILNNQRILPDCVAAGDASLAFSISVHKENDSFNDFRYWLWSSLSDIQTWLYMKDNKIYLELSPAYPWLFSDPEPSENYFDFEEYAKIYKPVALYELSRETVELWSQQCTHVLDTIETPSGYQFYKCE